MSLVDIWGRVFQTKGREISEFLQQKNSLYDLITVRKPMFLFLSFLSNVYHAYVCNERFQKLMFSHLFMLYIIYFKTLLMNLNQFSTIISSW